MINYSIVIPTNTDPNIFLRPCVESILQYTDMQNVEVIIVANGCPPSTRSFIESLGPSFKLVWFDQPIGYPRAINEGIKGSSGKYIVLLNDDTACNPPDYTNQWIDQLTAPFIADKDVGITGPVKFRFMTGEVEQTALAFWCVMISRDVVEQIGLLDEIFSPGMGEDGDYCIRTRLAGFKLVRVPYDEETVFGDNVEAVGFPMRHYGSGTFGQGDYSEIIKRNKQILDERYGALVKKFSIVIPTYNHCSDLLQPCIQSIIDFTDLRNVEVIVVANGCTDETAQYVASVQAQYPGVFKLIWEDEPLGYTKATNLGIKSAVGEYIVLLNNDTLLLPQNKNDWLNMLEYPFSDAHVGLVGPLQLHDDYADEDVLIFFCVMIRREVFEQIGLLDEVYSPGGGEDIDFTIRAKRAGWKAVQQAPSVFNGENNIGPMPIYHKNNKTFGEIDEYTNWIVKRNGWLNATRYNKNIRLNLGGGGIKHEGFLSVDKFDARADVKMDIVHLDIQDNTVSEIIASHVFEHLNPYHSLDILREWLRVLKPGGKLAMEMPDIEKLCARFGPANWGERFGILNAIYGSVNTTGVGGPDNITSPHLFGWWPESMVEHLKGAGFTDIQIKEEEWQHPESNFRVEARKPLFNADFLRSVEPNTFDAIFDRNEYSIVESDVCGKEVIDIGANLGFFTLKCLQLGAKRIKTVEAQPTVFELGTKVTLQQYPNVELINLAVTDKHGELVYIPNHHVGSQIGTDGEAVRTTTLEQLVLDVEDGSVLKMDCEGSEFDILLNTPKDVIRKFSTIFIEIHGNCNPNPAYQDPAKVRVVLLEAGFEPVAVVVIDRLTGKMADSSYDGPIDSTVEKWVRK